MLEEHDRIVLTEDVADRALKAGDVGTIVHVHRDGAAFEVEFLTLDGHTAALATVSSSQVRAVTGADITHAPHARDFRVGERGGTAVDGEIVRCRLTSSCRPWSESLACRPRSSPSRRRIAGKGPTSGSGGLVGSKRLHAVAGDGRLELDTERVAVEQVVSLDRFGPFSESHVRGELSSSLLAAELFEAEGSQTFLACLSPPGRRIGECPGPLDGADDPILVPAIPRRAVPCRCAA